MPFDEELRQFVIENYNALFGVDFLNEENFEDYFGTCYLTLGQSTEDYALFNMGIFGLLGALLGGVLWTAIGALGYISGWIGVLIVLFATTGYKLFAKEESGFGTAVSIIFSLLVIFPATYLAGVWTFYLELNKYVSEYIPLSRVFLEYSGYLTKTDNWGAMIYNMAIGYVCMLVTGFYKAVGVSISKRKKEEKSKVAQMANVNVNVNLQEEESNHDN